MGADRRGRKDEVTASDVDEDGSLGASGPRAAPDSPLAFGSTMNAPERSEEGPPASPRLASGPRASGPKSAEHVAALAMLGRRIGAYEITEFIARGGMGIVYAGRDTRLHRSVAIKALPPSMTTDAHHHARLLREAKLLASLSHPNIATVYGLEQDEGAHYIVMELVLGSTLAALLAHGPRPVREALSICLQIGRGVEAAHEAALIHRDLKPGNVVITTDGKVKVLDFGLARVARAEDGSDGMADAPPPTAWDGTLTRPHAILGTPGYMSPEQARGQAVDRRTDIFTFGAILFECLTGERAFQGKTAADLIAAVLEREPDLDTLPPDVPQRVRDLLRRCLAKDPARRLRDIGDVCLELEEVLREEKQPEAPRSAAVPPPARAAPARRGPLALVITGSVIAGAAATFALSRALVAPAPAPAATIASATAPPARQLDVQFPDSLPQAELSKLRLALAKDGHRIVFGAVGADGVLRLWSRRLDDGATTPLPATEDGWEPTLSPDGQWVAFYREGALWKRRLLGGDSVKIAGVSWWGGKTWGTDDVLSYSPDWGRGLFRISAQGGEPQLVTHVRHDLGDFGQILPCILPDNQAILFTSWNGKEDTRIEVVELATGERVTVVPNGSTPRFARTPRGDHLLWERKGTIYAARFDVAARRITGPESAIVDGVLTDGAQFASNFDVSDEGTLAWVSGPTFYEESRLSWIGEGQALKPFVDDILPFAEPHFSANGRTLSVLIKRKAYAPYVREEGRGTFDRVVFDSDVEGAAISPDGSMLAFSSNRDGKYRVWMKWLATGEEKVLIEPKGGFAIGFDWSPDGRNIALSMAPDEQSQRDVWIVTLGDPIEVRRFVDTPADDRSPSFSPNGKWLAYASEETDKREVYVRSFPDGKVKRQISTRGGSEPAWAPDGKRLYYLHDGKLVAAPMSPDDARPLGAVTSIYEKPFGQVDWDLANYAVAPDGRILIVEPAPKRTQVTRIQVMLGWHQRLP